MPSDAPSPDRGPSLETIEAAAAAWLSLRDRGMSPEETTSFLRWLQQDPRHAEVFAELDRTWASFNRLSAVPAAPSGKPDADLLAPRSRPKSHRMVSWAAIGVAAALVIGFFSSGILRPPRHTAETEVGAFSKIDLPDGSVAQLNTDSAIDAEFSATERRVRVARGEVFFTVAKDAARPFIVSVGPIAVRAVGTAFNIRQHPDAVEVLVTEGRVSVDDTRRAATAAPADAPPPLLAAGERTVVPLAPSAAPAPTIEQVPPAAVQRALAWQERRLEFDAVTLADVAREFNRYNRQQLVIADPELAQRRFSGAFRADGYESLVQLLATDFAVNVTREGRTIVLRLKR